MLLDRAGGAQGVGLNLTLPADASEGELTAELLRLRSAGADFVELTPHRLGVLLGGRVVPERADALAAAVEAAGVPCTVHAPDRLNLMEPGRSLFERRIFEASLRFAGRLGAAVLVYHSGLRLNARDARHSLRAQMAAERESLRDLGDLAGELGAAVAVENTCPDPAVLGGSVYAYGAWPSELAEQVAAVGHPAVGICLDLGHAWLAANYYGGDFVGECAAAAPLTRHLHIHDNFGQSDAAAEPDAAERWTRGIGDLHLAPGMGNIPFEDVFAAADFSRVTTCCVELSPAVYQHGERAVETARRLILMGIGTPTGSSGRNHWTSARAAARGTYTGSG